MPKTDKIDVLNKTVKGLFNTIGEDDILKDEGGGIWMSGGRLLKENEIKQLKAEAQTFLGSRLWRELKKDIQYRANKMMFEKAQTIEDLTAGKLWLYTLDVIETRLNKLK